MSFRKANTSTNDLPIAESTHIEEDSSKTPKSSRLTWTNKFGLRNNKVNPAMNPSVKQNSLNKSNLSKLDPTVYLDTTSNGFASRVVKYYEASEAKSRSISNQSYRRPGDFPIVNFDKSELNLNQRKENAPKISKINIAPPINLVSHASARSTIFRTGKNYGDTVTIGPPKNSKNNSSPSTGGPSETLSSGAHDEPIVPTASDYDGASARSSLDALKEISRKRILCDDLENDEKRKKQDNFVHDYDRTDGIQMGTATKRTRDRVSPGICSPSHEIHKKRYRNSDILSSLSSSVSDNKRRPSMLDFDISSTKRPQTLESTTSNEKQNEKSSSTATEMVNARDAINNGLNRVGASTSDLPHHKPVQYPKIVTKSISDSAVPQEKASKAPKLTLFNTDYKTSIRREPVNDADDEENAISFVKPKAKASTLFSLDKKDASKSKLAIMLSFLRGDEESKDEVDNVKSSNETDEAKQVALKATISTAANLTTSTVVTFSTATTTSVLNTFNVPASTITSGNAVNGKEVSKDVVPTTVSAPLISFSPMPTSKPSVASTIASETEKSKPKTVTTTPAPTFTLPGNLSSVPVTEAPKLEGFTFSPVSPSSETKGKLNAAAATITPVTTSAVTFSFGLSKSPAAPTTSIPSVVSFGSPSKTNDPPKYPGINSVIPASPSTASVPAPAPTTNNMFSFGAPKQVEPQAPKISFALPTTNVASTVQSAPTLNAPSTFSFGNTAASTTSVPANTTATNTTGVSFSFGNSATNTTTQLANDKPTFGATTTSATATNQSSTAFSFGNNNTANLSNTGGNAFQFGGASPATTKTQSNTFGSMPIANNTTTPNVNLFGGGSVQTTNTTTQPTFAFGNTAQTTVNSSFGGFSGFGQTTTAPSFNSVTNTVTTTTPSNLFTVSSTNKAPPAFGSTNNIFGSGNATQNPPVFGSASNTQNPPSFGSTANTQSPSGFGGAINTSNTPAFGSATNTQNPPTFGSATNTLNPPAFGSAANTQNPPAFGSATNTSNPPTFGTAINTQNAPVFGSANNAQNPPAFGSTTSTSNPPVFGSATNTQNPPAFGSVGNAQNPPSFGSTTNTQNPPAFGNSTTSSGMFAFGQTQPAAPAPTTTASGIFGSQPANAFVFGQSNTAQPPQAGVFGAKSAENPNQPNAQILSAPPAFNSSTNSAFNFTPKPNMFSAPNQPTESKPAFSFNSQNALNVTGFGSAPQFGGSNPANPSPSFNFSSPSNPAQDASKGFNFNAGPASAPTASVAPFSFSAPSPGAFQFNAQQQQQPQQANIFSIGPSTPTTKTGRPMRTATRRIK